MPQYLTPEEMQQMLLIPLTKRGKSHPMRVAIEAMKPGTILYIKREEFTWKNRSPKQFCDEIEEKRKKKFSVFKLIDGKGWVIKREK